MPDGVNQQVTGAVSQSNLIVVGEAPAVAIGSLYQTIGNSVALAAANNVHSQQQADVADQAASTASVTNLLTLPV